MDLAYLYLDVEVTAERLAQSQKHVHVLEAHQVPALEGVLHLGEVGEILSLPDTCQLRDIRPRKMRG